MNHTLNTLIVYSMVIFGQVKPVTNDYMLTTHLIPTGYNPLHISPSYSLPLYICGEMAPGSQAEAVNESALGSNTSLSSKCKTFKCPRYIPPLATDLV